MAENNENVAEEIKKVSESLDSTKDIIDSLTKKNEQAFNVVIRNVDTFTKTMQGELSAGTNAAVENLRKIAADSRGVSSNQRRQHLQDLKHVRNLIAAEKDDKIRSALVEQANVTENAIRQTTSIGRRITDGVVNNLDSIGGIMAGMLSESPVLAVLAAKGIETIQNKIKRTRELKDEERALHEEQQKESIGSLVGLAQQTAPESEPLEPVEIPDVKVESEPLEPLVIPDVNVESEPLVIPDVKVESESLEPVEAPEQIFLLEDIRDQLIGFMNAQQDSTENAEEERREGVTRDERLIEAIDGIEVSDDGKGETGSGGDLFGLFKGGKGGLMRFGAKLLKALPLLALVATIGIGIKDAFDTWVKTGSILDAFKKFGDSIVETISFGLITGEDLTKWGDNLGKWVFDNFHGIIEGFTNFFEGIIGIVTDAIGTLTSFGEGIGATLFDWFGDSESDLSKMLKVQEQTTTKAYEDLTRRYKAGEISESERDALRRQVEADEKTIKDFYTGDDSTRESLQGDIERIQREAQQGQRNINERRLRQIQSNERELGLTQAPSSVARTEAIRTTRDENEQLREDAKQSMGSGDVSQVNAVDARVTNNSTGIIIKPNAGNPAIPQPS